jgi:hypothetical protein
VTYTDFYLPWFAALAVASGEPTAAVASTATVLHFEGLDLPVVQSVLAVAGVLMARPLARKQESTLPLSHFLVVSAIMTIVALTWVAQSRPNVLFTFVVAIGLGFSGYSLVETAGAEIQAFLKRVFAMATNGLSNGGTDK